jgi:rhodanese-related sulfurtransferase
MKLVYRASDGRVLGAQAVGKAGVDKRIDVIAMAIQMGATVHDLAEAELCYAPQFGTAKDPVNFAGMIAENDLAGHDPILQWSDAGLANRTLLDVREPDEFADGHAPGARNIPLGMLRDSLGEIPRVKPIAVYCGVGARAHTGVRILRQNGFDAANLAGGFTSFRHVRG